MVNISSFICLAHSLFRNGNLSVGVGNEVLGPSKTASSCLSIADVAVQPAPATLGLVLHPLQFFRSGSGFFFMSSIVVIFLVGI